MSRKSDELFEREESNGLSITFKIPDNVLRTIDLEGQWVGKLSTKIKGRPGGRLKKLSRLQEVAEQRQARRIDPELREIITAWNEGADKPGPGGKYRKGQRNRQFKVKNIKDCEKQLQEVLIIYGAEQLLILMETYFQTRKDGGCYWNSIDHGYMTISGWAKSLLSAHRDGKALYWEPSPDTNAYDPEKDAYADITLMVADKFAQIILDTAKYGEVDSSWIKFEWAARRVATMYSESNQTISIGMFITMLIKCAHNHHSKSGRTVFPGTLYSDNLWKILLPQFLQINTPGFKMKRENED